MKTWLVALGAVVALGAPAAALARVVGRSSSSGDFAITITSATVKHPSRIRIQVLARPNQQVDGNWTLVCSRGFGAGSKSGSFKGRSPLIARTRFPMARPDMCTISASGSLSRGGTVTVRLLSP